MKQWLIDRLTRFVDDLGAGCVTIVILVAMAGAGVALAFVFGPEVAQRFLDSR